MIGIAFTIIAFLVLLILKWLLDLNLAPLTIKYLSWIPTRSVFRTKPPNLRGYWESSWDTDSPNFQNAVERHSNCQIFQLGSYCYGIFLAKSKLYYFTGRIENDVLLGTWHDEVDSRGYFGSFELLLLDSDQMLGIWTGHSKELKKIRSGEWRWTRVKKL